MNTLLADHHIRHSQYPCILDGIFQLRHRSFHERLQWEVQSSDTGMELDFFDERIVKHIALVDSTNTVVGCWRGIPTTHPYMLEVTFPELLQGEPAPKSPYIWEISRFTTAKESYHPIPQSLLGLHALLLIQSFYSFAVERGITSYVLVTTVSCERMLRSLGLTLRRMGDKKVLRIGKALSVALCLEVDTALASACSIKHDLKIVVYEP